MLDLDYCVAFSHVVYLICIRMLSLCLLSFPLQGYTGERLRRTMDWSWSAVADDVSSLTDQLTVWELRLFHAGATAVQNWEVWQQQGKRRSVVRRVVTPTVEDPQAGGESPSKRQRVE